MNRLAQLREHWRQGKLLPTPPQSATVLVLSVLGAVVIALDLRRKGTWPDVTPENRAHRIVEVRPWRW